MAHCKHWHNGSCKDCTKHCPIKAKLARQYAKAQTEALKNAEKPEAEMTLAAPSPTALAEAQAHGERVARLADKIFAALAPVYGLGEPWDAVLHTAARLHDIGWAYGQKAHHKTSARMIRKGSVEEVDAALRGLVALVARYHRRADPSPQQRRFAALTSLERRGVRRMAAVLRLADALDYSHAALVQDVEVTVQEEALRLVLHCPQGCTAEMARLDVKKASFVKVFKKDVVWACKEQETAEQTAAPLEIKAAAPKPTSPKPTTPKTTTPKTTAPKTTAAKTGKASPADKLADKATDKAAGKAADKAAGKAADKALIAAATAAPTPAPTPAKPTAKAKTAPKTASKSKAKGTEQTATQATPAPTAPTTAQTTTQATPPETPPQESTPPAKS